MLIVPEKKKAFSHILAKLNCRPSENSVKPFYKYQAKNMLWELKSCFNETVFLSTQNICFNKVDNILRKNNKYAHFFLSFLIFKGAVIVETLFSF